VEYLPAGNRNFVFAFLSPPPGYNMNQLLEMGEQIEADLQPYWDIDADGVSDKDSEYPGINYYFYVVRGRRVFMGARSADPSRVRELIPLLRKIGSQFPGTIAVAKQSSLFERGITGGRTIDVEITGPDLKQLVAIGKRVMEKVKETIPEAQALPRPSLDLSSPEIHLVPKLVQAAEMGVNTAELGYTVNALVDGAYAGDYFIGGEKIDMTIMGNDSLNAHTQDLTTLPIATPSGQLVPLAALADVKLRSGPEQINRREQLRAITIQVSPPAQMPLEDAMERINSEIVQPMLADPAMDGGYMINLSGTADKLRETWESLKWNLFLALAITYLLMAALFESWLYPFVIIVTVPLGAVGGLLGLRLLNVFVLQPLDVLTMLGFIILIGTVVNNAILIVHQSLNHMRHDGMPPHKAIPESVRNRIRPIFITTTTTVLGLLPLVLFPGAGSELYRGLGSVVLGGLLVSTIFTLILVPAVFTVMLRLKAVMIQLGHSLFGTSATAHGLAVETPGAMLEAVVDMEETLHDGIEMPSPVEVET
jgi:HAE1 family hydrophobic/amphiphilic exporter-1